MEGFKYKRVIFVTDTSESESQDEITPDINFISASSSPKSAMRIENQGEHLSLT
jgi:hypothetical protein